MIQQLKVNLDGLQRLAAPFCQDGLPIQIIVLSTDLETFLGIEVTL